MVLVVLLGRRKDMACCGKTIRKVKQIATGYGNLVRGKKYEFTDDRIRACQKCNKNYWISRRLFCAIRLRRFGSTFWPDPFAFVPGFARIENEECFLGKWEK